MKHPHHAAGTRSALAACVATAICLGAPAAAMAVPTTWTVNTCSEANTGSGTTGSLRYAAANAISGDTIDLTNTGCSTISLTTGGGGAVGLGQTDITLKGPGKAALTIQSSNDRVLFHSGSGTLTVNDLTVANGYLHPGAGTTAKGACIFAYGKLTLSHVGVHSCRAVSYGAPVRGGGIYAKTGVFAKYSDITGNTATNSGANANGGGGGIFTYGYALLASSTLSGNSAQTGAGGGLRAFGDAVTIASTVSGNIAKWGGGIYARDNLTSASDTFTVLNSTLSGNQALNVVGGAWTNAGTIHVYNSTVAFNTAGSATRYGSRHYGSGFTIDDLGAYYTDINHYKFKKATLHSSVFSNNTSGTAPSVADDFGIVRFSNLNLVGISGQNNIVFGIADSFLALPGSTVTLGACPLLGPLRNNGGPTKTHALMSHSPAIDAGNILANGISPYDQRGLARVSGTKADMGAYEVQQNDTVFNAGFDGCP